MKKIIRIVAYAIIFLYVFNLAAVPMPADAASTKYGVITVNPENGYQLYNNMIIVSPEGNLMVKAYSICKKLGLIYSFNKDTNKLTIKNPANKKSLVFTIGSKKFVYYSSDKSEGSTKNATYKAYYDTKEECNVIHMQTLKYIVGYNYYKDLNGTYYDDMGYKSIVVYSVNDDNVSELPITNQLLEYINSKTFTTQEELLNAVRLNLLLRNTNASFKTNREVMEQIGSKNSIYSIIVGMDDKNTPKDGDYLALLIDKFGQKWKSSSKIVISPDGSEKEIKSKDDQAILTIDVTYETTLEQEMVVDAMISGIIKELKLEGATDYDKVKLIHDYIINNTSYDTKFVKSSAYDLLVEKEAVCEGYALVAYRLFLAAGLESRIISGEGNGEPHAWNIVKVDGKWYNIDLTWDDPITNTGRQVIRYDYFLKSDKEFPNHIRRTEFQTKDFLQAYPMATESYK